MAKQEKKRETENQIKRDREIKKRKMRDKLKKGTANTKHSKLNNN